MRIATSHFYQRALNELLPQQAELAKVQEQIATGKRILSASDDPAGAARALNISQGLERVKQFDKNAGFAEQRLSLEDTALDGVTDLLQRVRDLSLQANSGAQTSADRAAYRVELEQRLQELLDYANTKDANGEYLFSGHKGRTQPFSLGSSGTLYNGDQGQQFIQVGPTRQIANTDSGYHVFQQIRNGNGAYVVGADSGNGGTGVIAAGSVVDRSAYQADEFTIRFTSATTYDVINDTTATTIASGQVYAEGEAISFNGIETSIGGAPTGGDQFTVKPSQQQDVFATLQGFIDAMAIDPVSGADKAQLDQAINGVIGDLDNALDHILEVRTSVGARLNAIDSSTQENESLQVQLQQTLSEVQDLDYAEAISRLQFRMTTLQAVQQSFSQIQGLSLFNFLR